MIKIVINLFTGFHSLKDLWIDCIKYVIAPKTGALCHEPKIGAMSNIKLSVHAPQHVWLRKLLIQRRLELGLSQRSLAMRLGVIYSFVGKVETGDRRLDLFEFIQYCHALELNSVDVLQHIEQNFYPL